MFRSSPWTTGIGSSWPISTATGPASKSPTTGSPWASARPSAGRRGPPTSQGRLAVAAAKAFGGDTAIEISNEIFALAGTRAADNRINLHRHWRNARTHTLHDPNRWKYLHIGNFTVNGLKPPNHGLI